MRRSHALTWRSVIIGLLLIPINAWWLMQIEHIRYSDMTTTAALFLNAVSALLLLLGLSALIRLVLPRLAPFCTSTRVAQRCTMPRTCVPGWGRCCGGVAS